MRLLAIGAVTAYNVNELPASIINKPGVFQPETVSFSAPDPLNVNFRFKTSYFGFSLAVREIDGEANVLIGAPSHQDTGALYNCNVYGKCQDFDAGKNHADGLVLNQNFWKT